MVLTGRPCRNCGNHLSLFGECNSCKEKERIDAQNALYEHEQVFEEWLTAHPDFKVYFDLVARRHRLLKKAFPL